MKTDRLSSPQYQTHTWTGHAMARGYCGLVTPQVKLRNIKYGLISFCDGRCLAEVVKGYQEIMWGLRTGRGETVMRGDDDLLTAPLSSWPDSHCTLTALTLQLTVCWVLSVECWDVHIGLNTEQPCVPVCPGCAGCVWAPGSPPCQPPVLPAGGQTGRNTIRTRPETRESKNFTKMQTWTFCVSANAWLAWQLPQHLLWGANKHFIPGRNNLRSRSLFSVKRSCPN